MNSSEPYSQFCFQYLDCHFLPAIAYVFSVFSSFICQQFSPHPFTVLFSSTPSLFLRSSFFFLFIFLDFVFEYSSIHYGTTVIVLISEGSSDKWEVNWYLVIRSPRGVITKRWLAEGEKEPHPKLQALKKAVEIGKERLRLNIIAIDHAIIRSIMRGTIFNFSPDRSSKYWQTEPRKLRQNCPRLRTKSLHFQSLVMGADFERQKRQESFELQQLQRACSRTVIRTDNVRSMRGRSDFETWRDFYWANLLLLFFCLSLPVVGSLSVYQWYI